MSKIVTLKSCDLGIDYSNNPDSPRIYCPDMEIVFPAACKYAVIAPSCFYLTPTFYKVLKRAALYLKKINLDSNTFCPDAGIIDCDGNLVDPNEYLYRWY